MFVNSAFAYGSANMDDFGTSKSKIRILYGLILVVGGGFLAYDGFRDIKVDISNPGYKITGSGSWDYNKINVALRDFESSGVIENTGNVAIKMLSFEVRYLGGGDTYPQFSWPQDSVNPPPNPVHFSGGGTLYAKLEAGETASWTNELDGQLHYGHTPNGENGISYPYPYTGQVGDHNLVSVVGVKCSYDKKYKTEMNNVYEGIAGVLVAGAGLYILIDYIVGLSKFDYYMKKNDMKFYVTNNYDEFRLNIAKRI